MLRLMQMISIGFSLTLSLTSINSQAIAAVHLEPPLTLGQLKHWCQPLIQDAPQDVMSAFSAGQCSHYILGVYDTLHEFCSTQGTPRAQAVQAVIHFMQKTPSLPTQAPALPILRTLLLASTPCQTLDIGQTNTHVKYARLP
ncbi:hypothetical protein SAMN05421831_101247 [Allopseudospirillum japonicum]|uniref:Rap1a immunity protein domain-containing protein n=1 Tax=Allopseudospirillum japonicum TaxID=64971 RepID=A0A1H6QH16_9GAMM|nr:Rap1a/Tai family immunity protein [Allopseudospirillum japonicum]SEI39507.1 hypothetical protein SAMN05421831_101247 [Allopseudospirillum japonicum]